MADMEGAQYVTVEKEGKGVAIVTIKREPVNSMNLDLWSQLSAAIDQCEKDKEVRGIIICSGLQKDIFTAGNDITELYAKTTSAERFPRFWHAQTSALVKLYRSPLVTIAAVRGHCPAGGCVLALCCDVRIVTEDCKMGLNEVALGISVPRYWVVLMEKLIGGARADTLLQTATFVPAAEAKAIGMVDAVVSKDHLMTTAAAEMKRRLAFPDSGRVSTKNFLRRELADAWAAYSDEEAREGWKGLSAPPTVAALGAVLAKLSGGNAQKPAPKL